MISFFELWVSYKFLFPKTKEKFFSIITFISFAGISLGVATLIIVMSVMNGFRDELTSKILGVNGHLKVKPFNNFKIEKHDELKINIEKKNQKYKRSQSYSWSGFTKLSFILLWDFDERCGNRLFLRKKNF